MHSILNLWQETERLNATKLAVIDDNNRLTYKELGTRIRAISNSLIEKWKVRRGEVVALMVPNCVDFVISYFAIVNAGAVVQPIDERLMPNEIEFILQDSGTRRLIVHGRLWPKFKKVEADLPSIEKVLGVELSENGYERFEDWLVSPPMGKDRWLDLTPDDKAELMYTSGTTGKAKGVVRTHRNVLAATRNASRGFGYRDNDIICIMMPLSHSSALVSQMMPFIQYGRKIVIMKGFDLEELLETIPQEGVTCMRAVPDMIRIMLSSSKFCSDELPSLRLLLNSSAAIDPELFVAVKERFRDIELVNSYGLTEASTSTVLSDYMALIRPDAIGVPIEGVEMSIRTPEGGVIEDESEGEICIRGDHVFWEYHNKPVESQAVLEGDWLHTGDLGHRDAMGLFYFHGRMNDVINCGGYKFSPLEVENCILKLPEIAEAAVVGVPYRMMGSVVKAFIVLQEDAQLDPKVITRHCTKNLSSYKVPLFIEFVNNLPKNSTGKILRRKLVSE